MKQIFFKHISISQSQNLVKFEFCAWKIVVLAPRSQLLFTFKTLQNLSFQDLFKGVIYAGIATDKYKYPIGSGRVVFNNLQSYMKAFSLSAVHPRT